MSVIVDGSEIVLKGYVGGEPDGDDFWSANGFGSTDVIGALAQIGRDKDVTIRLNSGGGIAVEGAAIHAALSAHKGKVHIVVEGAAASAASLIAMAADRLTMSPGAIMMIHDPAGSTFGNAAAHQKAIEALDVLGNAYAAIYAERSKKTVGEARELMKAETWLDGQAAIAAGFADDLGADNDNEAEPAAFAYGDVYAKAPERFVALANARGWKARATTTAPAVPTRQKDPTMTTQTPAGSDPATEPQNAPEPTTEPTPPAPPADPVADAAAIAAVCAAFMNADQITAFIKNGGTVEKARARATEVGEIRAAVALAGKQTSSITAATADEFIAQGRSLAEVRSALFEKIVANQSPEVSAAPPVDTKTASAAWDKVVARTNARLEA